MSFGTDEFFAESVKTGTKKRKINYTKKSQ